MPIALTSPTGKLGGAVLNAILENKLIDPKNLVVCTSSNPSDPRFTHLRTQSISLRQANFDDPPSLISAYTGCDKLFLASTPRVEMDYNNAPLWQGREKHHRAAIDAAVDAGVRHIYYTSLAFKNPSQAAVMRAHIRTEKYLKELEEEGKVMVTIIREGLYNESWPLYFGYYFGLKNESRREVVVAGDGQISWTSISDMAFGTAKVLAAPSHEWTGKTFYLSQTKTHSLQDIADMVSKIQAKPISLKIVKQREYEDFYASRGTERDSVEWWSSSYAAISFGECAISDPTLSTLLKDSGRTPTPLETTIAEMLR